METEEIEINEPHSGTGSAANTFQLMFTWRALKKNIGSNLQQLEREKNIDQQFCSINIITLEVKRLQERWEQLVAPSDL